MTGENINNNKSDLTPNCFGSASRVSTPDQTYRRMAPDLVMTRAFYACVDHTHGGVITATTYPAPTPDPVGTIGDPATNEDSLPADSLTGWTSHRRLNFSYDGPGGLITVYRGEIHRATRDIASSLAQACLTRGFEREIVAAANGLFKIPGHIASDRFRVGSTAESTYVQLMFAFFDGNVAGRDLPLVPWVADFGPSRRVPDDVDSPSILRSLMWYALSMLLGAVVLARDYEVLKTDRSVRVDVAPAPSANRGEVLRLPASELPKLPAVILDHAIPTHLPVPEPLFLQFFATYLAGFPGGERLKRVASAAHTTQHPGALGIDPMHAPKFFPNENIVNSCRSRQSNISPCNAVSERSSHPCQNRGFLKNAGERSRFSGSSPKMHMRP